MASTQEMLDALRKAEAGTKLSRNEQHALEQLAKVHDSNGARARELIGESGDGKGILGI